MGCTDSKMEHAGTDNINGGADIEVEPRAEIQSLKDVRVAVQPPPVEMPRPLGLGWEGQGVRDTSLNDKRHLA